MGIIAEINDINREKSKSITRRVQEKRKQGDTRPFAEILNEELKKEKLLSGRVGAHKSDNNISKEFNDSIALYEDIDNGEIYNIKTGETIRSL